MRSVCRAGLWLLLAGCAGDGTSSGEGPAQLSFVGADISALERIEQAGIQFNDNGQVADGLTILRNHGYNLFRLRVFVAPSHNGLEVNDLAYTLRMATRIKASGASLLLDLHYSDTWADPGHQTVPAAWAQLGFDSLEQRVEDYTTDVVAALDSAGVAPDIVQIGNEIDAGMLWPMGQVGGAGDTTVQWSQLTRLLKAGIRGVTAGLAPGHSARIMLHYSNGGNSEATAWFFDHVNAAAVTYDLIGLSYYPWWHGKLADLKANLTATANRFGKDIMVVETSYPWRTGGWESFATNRSAMTWSASRTGQTRFVRDVAAAIAATPGGHGVGIAWWYPESVQVPGIDVLGGGSLALFDATRKALPAVSALETE